MGKDYKNYSVKMEFNTRPIEIEFATGILVDAIKKNLNLYCPVDSNDVILYEQAYWASEAKNSQDISLDCCPSGAFAFDEGDAYCLELPSHYTTLELPATASEYKSLLEQEAFERHVSGLVGNGCSVSEAYAIATSHATGLPVVCP
jgi:hypothetical protein